MLEELKRRTSNFFPVSDTIDGPFGQTSPISTTSTSPNLIPKQDLFYDRPLNSVWTPSLSTPSFLSPNHKFSLNLLSSPNAFGGSATTTVTPGHFSPRPRVSLSAPNVLSTQFLERKLDFDLTQLNLLSLAENQPHSNPFLDTLFGETALGHSDPTFSMKRSSIWSTPKTEEVQTFASLQILLPLPTCSFEPLQPALEKSDKKFNIYSNKLHTPIFVPGGENKGSSGAGSRRVSDLGKNETKRKKLPSIVVNLARKTAAKLPPLDLSTLCSKHVLNHLHTKEYPEDYCSTFYKRNKHAYMFTRESSSSLKVNASGPKSWVTIKLKLGHSEPQKLKVDVKKFPMWKPINLNQPTVPRKYAKKGRGPKRTGPKR